MEIFIHIIMVDLIMKAREGKLKIDEDYVMSNIFNTNVTIEVKRSNEDYIDGIIYDNDVEYLKFQINLKNCSCEFFQPDVLDIQKGSIN